MERARGFLKKLIKIIQKPEMRILPGQLAFFIFMSIIPLIALIGVIAGRFNVSALQIKEVLGSSIPKATIDFIVTRLGTSEVTVRSIIFLVIAMLLASNGTHSIIITSNEIYKIKSRNFLARRFKALLMIFILIALLLVLMVGPVFGNKIFNLVARYISDVDYINILRRVYTSIKYPSILILLYLNIKVLYILAPDKKVESISATRGAIFSSILWIIASLIYASYTEKISYDTLYGSAAGIIITMFWIYIISYIFVLGMAINAGIDEEIK